jgi:hypothetical protein
MKKSIAKDSRNRSMASRVGAAGVALATALVLAGCHEARGGGYIGQAVPFTTNPIFNGRADFGFTFQCDDGVKGEITYHDASTSAKPISAVVFPGLRIHGTVENVLIDDDNNPDTKAVPADTCEQVAESRWAQFEGSYRPQDTTLPSDEKTSRFVVVVFDQGEPGVGDPVITGDGFSIELFGPPYVAYTRSGYIEGGNIQVDN